MKTIKFCLLFFLFSCLVGCTQLNPDRSTIGDRSNQIITSNNSDTKLAEITPPQTIKELNSSLKYLPEVEIVAPQAEQTFNRTDIEVRLNVENLPIFKDDTLQLGNHLNLVVDNEPLQPIYSIQEPIIIKNLSPGTHTIRVFAVRPWGESFKNEKAYAQTTFNVLTETNDNRPKPGVPLLTYNSPTGTYGAEPLLLDFYLTNAPLHAIAQNNPNLKDWRIKATVNGTSFILEDWQPIYLTGLEPKENWIQLELVDETGNSIENAFNNTVRVFTYDLQQNDALAKLMSDRLTLAQARSIVDPDYSPKSVEIAENIEQTNSIKSNTLNAIDTVSQFDPTAEVITPTLNNEPTVSTSKFEEKKILEQAQASLETPIFEPAIEPEVNPTSDFEVPTSNSIAAENSFEKYSDENSIITTEESNLEPSVTIESTQRQATQSSDKGLTTIVMPQPESAEVAIADSPTNLKPTTGSWWKKILVGLRQKIEALAKSLPDEV